MNLLKLIFFITVLISGTTCANKSSSKGKDHEDTSDSVDLTGTTGKTTTVERFTTALNNENTKSKLDLDDKKVAALIEEYKESETDPIKASEPLEVSTNHVLILSYEHKKAYAALQMYKPASKKTFPINIAAGSGFWIERVTLSPEVSFISTFSITKMGSTAPVSVLEAGAVYRLVRTRRNPPEIPAQYFTVDVSKPESTVISIYLALPAGKQGQQAVEGFRALLGYFRLGLLSGGWGLDAVKITDHEI